MSEVMHPVDTAGPGSAPSAAGQTSPAAKVAQRPSLVTFAAVMLFLVGAFSVVWAIVAFTQPEWLRNAYSAYGVTLTDSTWLWGLLDLLVGAIAVYAGFSTLRGGAFAQIIGLSIAGFCAVRWFFFLPVVPWVAITIIALDVLVVYGLAAHSEYFDTLQLE